MTGVQTCALPISMANILDEPLLPADERPTLDIQDIMALLPHRYPFLLVDRVEWSRASRRSAIGYKGITYNEEYFQGHFPKMPVMPGFFRSKQWRKPLVL